MEEQATSRWPQIIIIYGLSVASAMVVSEGVPALGGIAAEFHPRSPALIGLVMSIPALVVALGGLLTGWLVDQAGDRRVLLVGGLIMLVGDAGVIVAPTLGLLLVSRVVAGAGYLCMAVAAVAMLTRISQGRERVAALALWSTVIPASFIAAFICGALLHGVGWRWVFGVHVIVSAVLLAIGVSTLPARAAGEAMSSRTAGIVAVLRSPWPYMLGTSFAAAAFLQTGMIAVLVKLLAMRIGASEAEVHSFGILAMLFNMGGAFAVGMLLNRGLPAWLIGASGAAIAAVGTLLLRFVVPDLTTAIAVDCLLMAGCGLLAGMWALLPRAAPSPQAFGATSGLITQITLIGVLFGPPAAFAALGLGSAGFLLIIGVMLLGTAVAVPVWLKKSPQGPATGAASGPVKAGAVH
jgi:predicted MFS family arabinose efflux permease